MASRLQNNSKFSLDAESKSGVFWSRILTLSSTTAVPIDPTKKDVTQYPAPLQYSQYDLLESTQASN